MGAGHGAAARRARHPGQRRRARTVLDAAAAGVRPAGEARALRRGAPYGRPGQPVEIASTYVYLASQDASYTSGEVVAVTGGTPVH
ncbi:SDR family oxidoreductase [Pseudolysinimonas kribbensis]|uniref:SDR family oxidoreductase n=1 Tax=Pseudolysinimonas kribbensis TaxID=433641 RepID=UPI0032AED795